MKTMRGLLTLAVAVCLAVPAFADDAEKGKGKKKGERGQRAVGGQAFALPKGIELSAEQQEQVAALKKEYGPKLREMAKEVGLTADQKKAMVEARKAAQADGKKGKDLRAAVDAAVNLSDEQKAAQAEMQDLTKEIRGKVMGLLTDEQKAKLPKRGAGDKKPREKKPKKADAA